MSLLVGTATGALRLDDDEPFIVGTRINHITVDEYGWWALDGRGRVHRNGEVVVTMPPDVAPLCIQPTPDTVWIGASEARLYAYERGAVMEDEFFAIAPGRDSWYTPWGAPPDIRSMTLDADLTLYVNVHVGGILRYDDTGVAPTVDINSDVHQVVAHPNLQGAVFAATAQGLAHTHNGHEFEFRTEGLHATYCRAVAVLEDHVLISASTGPRTSQGRLYKTGLWDGPLVPLTAGLPEWFPDNINTHCLVVRDGSVFAALADTIWRSDDEGESWMEVATGLPKITCLA